MRTARMLRHFSKSLLPMDFERFVQSAERIAGMMVQYSRTATQNWKPDMALRTLFIACLLCSLGCGGGSSDSDTSDAAASSEPAESSDSSPASGMMDEHGSSGDPAAMAAPDPGAMDEHGMSSDPAQMASLDSGMMNEHGVAGGTASTDAAMMAEYENYTNDGSGEMRPGGQVPRKPARPEKIEDWTPEHVADAIRETDVKVIPAIEAFANKTKAQARGVDQLKTWLTALSEKPEAKAGQNSGYDSGESLSEETVMENYNSESGYGESSFGQSRGASKKEKITNALLEAFATNATKPAYETLASILSGQLTVGEDKNKAMEMAFVKLMKNVSDPNNPAEDQLLKAMTSLELDGAPPAKEKDEKPADSLQKSVKELHLGFAITAMNGLIGAKGQPSRGKQNNSSGYSSGEMSGYPGGSSNGTPENGQPQNGSTPEAKPIQVAPIDLKPEEAPATLSYLWSDEMVAYAVSQLTKYPESTEAFVFASAIPVPAARDAVRKAINDHRLEPPQKWLHESVIASQLADPAIHLLIKEFPREARPGGNQGGGENGLTTSSQRPGQNRNKKDEDPDALRRKEVSYGWMDASEQTLVSLMQRMYEGSLRPEAKPFDPSGIPFSLHKGAEVTASLQFILPDPKQPSSELSKAQQTIVNYVRIESETMNQKTVLHYRNSMRDKQVVTILGNNGMWLDGPVKPNRKNGTLRSVDILLSKGGARPSIDLRKQNNAGGGNSSVMSGAEVYASEGNYGTNGASGGTPVIEILTVEIPPAVVEEEAEKVTATN
jgi:hypothetical protein